MKYALLFFTFFTATTFCKAQSWTLKNSLYPQPTADGYHTNAVVGSKVYIGIFNGSNPYFHAYDPTTNAFMPKSLPPSSSVGCGRASFSLNGKIYVMDEMAPYHLYEYTPNTNTWVTKSALLPFTQNWTDATSFFSGKKEIYFSINNKGYIGGFHKVTISNFQESWLPYFYEYDPIADTFIQKANIPVSFNNETCVSEAIAQKAYVFGGLGINGSFINANHAFSYDASSNTWTEIAVPIHGSNSTYPGGMAGATFVLNNKIFYGLSGSDALEPDFMVETYDPITNSWSVGLPIPTTDSIKLGMGFSLNNKGYIGYGERAQFVQAGQNTKLWEYSPPISQSVKNITPIRLKISPNPASSEISIDLEKLSDGITSVRIYNILGQEVIRQNYKDKNIIISIVALPPGLYNCIAENNQASITGKFIKL